MLAAADKQGKFVGGRKGVAHSRKGEGQRGTVERYRSLGAPVGICLQCCTLERGPSQRGGFLFCSLQLHAHACTACHARLLPVAVATLLESHYTCSPHTVFAQRRPGRGPGGGGQRLRATQSMHGLQRGGMRCGQASGRLAAGSQAGAIELKREALTCRPNASAKGQ